MLILPFEPSRGAYEFSTVIDGVDYKFDVHWNARDNVDLVTGKPLGAWYFDISEQNNTPIVRGVKIVLGAVFGRSVQHRLFTSGVMRAIDLTRQSQEATFDDLGVRVQVRWVPVDEAFALLTEAGVDP